MEKHQFQLENQLVERQVFIENGVPVRSVLRNKKSGMEWSTDGKEAVIALPGVALEGSRVTGEKWMAEDGAEMLRICFLTADYEVHWEWKLWEDLAVMESRIGAKRVGAQSTVSGEMRDYIDSCGCSSQHVNLSAIQFYDCSDETDFLVEKRECPLYSRGTEEYNGHIFILQEKITGEELLWVKNAPCEVAQFHRNSSDFVKHSLRNIHLCGGGISSDEVGTEDFVYTYPAAIGVCEKGEALELFRRYYQKDFGRNQGQKQGQRAHYIMSNTWGDRNCDKCVCEEFILKEIEAAAQLGCDIVQIDDGWQQGITANSLLASGGAWTGKFRLSDPDFWQANRKKFPNGLGRIAEAARAHGLELGLWFSPDSEQDYADWELDAEVMIGFYREHGIRYFKIDGVVIRNQICVEHLLKMFARVQKACDGQVTFNMDITAGKRFGYLYHREVGDIFVENRYTDFGNYYPHNTLRNLWELSQYLPAQRLQMEVLNNRRNVDKYDDILAPGGYEMDYLFASVMAAKPLLWMEMSELDEESRRKLISLIAIYQKYRDDFEEVVPIMEKPSGFSRTGFLIRGGKQDYVILLRELSEQAEFPYCIREILATNDPDAAVQTGAGSVRLNRKRSYLFGVLEQERSMR